MKNYKLSIIMLILFEIIAVTLWLSQNNIFYFYNFSYIGLSISLGIGLMLSNHPYGRYITQLLVGSYILIYLGIISRENMQIEGFWYYLFNGIFEGAVIHYLIAKIFGPLLFGRGWCGYACYSAMIFDLLPYKVPKEPRKKFGYLKYILFILSFLFVIGLIVLKVQNIERVLFISFIIGNIFYYIAGILLALILKDNRAFCKYLCPVTIFLKPMSSFSLLKIEVDQDKCIKCKKCNKVCPMNLDITDLTKTRYNASECILCLECKKNCPANAIH